MQQVIGIVAVVFAFVTVVSIAGIISETKVKKMKIDQRPWKLHLSALSGGQLVEIQVVVHSIEGQVSPRCHSGIHIPPDISAGQHLIAGQIGGVLPQLRDLVGGVLIAVKFF